MAIRTFWHLIIKTIGIWIFIQGLLSLPGLVMNLLVAYESPYNNATGFILTEVLMFVVPVAFYIFVLRYLVLKTQSIINLLRLEKGMEEMKIDISLPFDKILHIIIILIGGFIFVLAIPSLIKAFYLFINEELAFRESPRTLDIISNSVQAIIGFLIMNNSDIVQRYINKKSSESESKQLDKEEF